MNPAHPELATGRWRSLSFAERMANLGSEVTRALNWRDRGRRDLAARAADRALELFDLTLAEESSFHRLREIARTRESFAAEIYGDPSRPGPSDQLRKYFLQFAAAARRRTNGVPPSAPEA